MVVGYATSFVGLLIVVTWQLSGYMMVIYIAQLQNIPDNLLEAAEIDGANSWQKLRSITLPLVAPAFTSWGFFSRYPIALNFMTKTWR